MAEANASRILLVDDEPAVQTLLAYPLRKDGYEVVSATDGRQALDRFAEGQFDLVVLDVMLPKLDGIEVCRRLRSKSQVPIIMLTAKDDEIDKVVGLEMGADDYITKPFSVREFRSRVRAALRRAEMGGRVSVTEPIEAGELELDLERRAAKMRGEDVTLTYVEFEVLSALAGAPGRVFTREVLIGPPLGGLQVPRPAHHRRPYQTPPREDRKRSVEPRVPLHGAGRRLQVSRNRRSLRLDAGFSRTRRTPG